jgi:hypothetical protein
MLPGPDIIIACPQCGALARVFSLMSGNTLGATLWTDAYMDAPMLPRPPAITRCDNCTAFFWVKDAPRVGKVSRWSDEPAPEAWRNAPEVRPLSEDEHWEAIANGSASNSQEERLLRTWAWWTGNHRFRDLPGSDWRARKIARSKVSPKPSTDEIFSSAARQNLERLVALLEDTPPDDRLTKAEAARELGQFDQAIALLSVPFSEEYDFVARYILDLAQRGVSVVRKIPQRN